MKAPFAAAFLMFHLVAQTGLGAGFNLAGLPGVLDTGRISSMAALLSEFLTDSTPFVARAELTVGDSDGGTVRVPMAVSMKGGRSRWNVNLAGSSRPAETVREMRVQMKLSKLALIVQADRTRVLMPDASAYADMTNQPNRGVQLEAAKQLNNVKRTYFGRETLNGLACSKFKASVPDGYGGIMRTHPASGDPERAPDPI